MSENLLARVGHIAVAWNEAEYVLNRLLWLYLDTDAQTAAILTRPMRAADREKLLRALVDAKEIDKTIAEEIGEAIKLCAACRENRNTILHSAGGSNGEFADGALTLVTDACGEITKVVAYLRELQAEVTKIIFARAGRETPIDEDHYGDELFQLPQFNRPTRPGKPTMIARSKILPEGYND